MLCGVLSFNSASCYGFLNQREIANATTPSAKQIDLTGSWTIKRPWTRVDSEGCTAQNPPGVSGDYTGEFKVIQDGKQFQFAPEMVGNGVTLQGSVDERKISFVYTTSTGGVHEAVGTISADGNTVTSEALCSSSRGPATVREEFIWTRKSCPRFKTMLSEAQDIQKLADTLEKDDKAYHTAVIDIILRGYSAPYAVYMLDVPSDEIPDLFKDETQIRAVRSQIIERVSTKARNRKKFADTGISGEFMPQTPIYSKENIELFCTLDSSKFTKEFWDSLWMAGYIDYNFYKGVEDQLIRNSYQNYFEILVQIANLIPQIRGLKYIYRFKGKEYFFNEPELVDIKRIESKELPEVTETAEADIEQGIRLSPERLRHILDGDTDANGNITGGGHGAGRNIPGKSEFPSSWSDEKIIQNVKDVIRDPNSEWTLANEKIKIPKPSGYVRWKVKGTRDGIDIEVIVLPLGEGIITAYPRNVLPNPVPLK